MSTEETFGAAQIRKLYSQNFGIMVEQIDINELSDEQIEKVSSPPSPPSWFY